MKVAKHKVVTLEYRLSDAAGETLDSSTDSEPLRYVHGTGGLLEGLETALEGHAAGDRFPVILPPEKAYGLHDPKLLRVVPRDEFPADQPPRVGRQFRGDPFGGELGRGPRVVTVVRVEEQNVTLDFNHPLAGVTLRFEVEITQVRDATPEECQAGMPNRPDEM